MSDTARRQSKYSANPENSKGLPQDTPAEQATLGAMLVDPGAVERALAIVRPEDFLQEAHQRVFAAMQNCYGRGEPVDVITVGAELRRSGQLETAGGAAYLTALIGEVPTSAHIERYASIVGEKSLARQMIAAGADLQALGYADPEDIGQAIETARGRLEALVARRAPPPEVVATPLSALGATIQSTSWLWPGWIPRGYLTVIASMEGEGKSILLAWLAAAAAGIVLWPDGAPSPDPPLKTLWVEAEARQGLLYERVSGWGAGTEHIVLPGEDCLRQLRLDDATGIGEIAALARDREIGLVGIDSLSAAHSGDENSSAVRLFLRDLAEVARDTNAGIVLNHHVRKRSQMEPLDVTLERLRGSSAVGQMAISVLAIDRPDVESDVKRLRCIKLNLAAQPPALGYVIGTNAVPSFPEAPTTYREPTQVDKASDFLRVALRKGPRAYSDLMEEAESQGISRRTLYRAQAALAVVVRKAADGRRSLWGLPEVRDY